MLHDPPRSGAFDENVLFACAYDARLPRRHEGRQRAFDQARLADSAIASFERYIDTPQLNRFSWDATYRAGILRRLGALYEAKGERAKAIEYYERFVQLWQNADPELQPRVADVRRRIESLRARGDD